MTDTLSRSVLKRMAATKKELLCPRCHEPVVNPEDHYKCVGPLIPNSGTAKAVETAVEHLKAWVKPHLSSAADDGWAPIAAILTDYGTALVAEAERQLVKRFMDMPYAPVSERVPDIDTALEYRQWHEAGWAHAHEPARCGHARGNCKDPNYGTPEYDGDERCEVCALVAKKERATMSLPDMVGDVSVEEVIGPHNGGMICEKHPEREWPHSDPSESDGECPGPGMPLSNRLSSLVWERNHERERAEQAEAALARVRELHGYERGRRQSHDIRPGNDGRCPECGGLGSSHMKSCSLPMVPEWLRSQMGRRALSGSTDETAGGKG